MNTLKPLLIFAALVGACYYVYSRINHKSDIAPEGAVGWDGSVSVENGEGGPLTKNMPGLGAAPGRPPMTGMTAGPDQYGAHDPHGSDPRGSDPRGSDFAPPDPAAGNWHGSAPAGAPGAAGADYTVGGGAPYQQAAGAGGAPPDGYGAAADPYGAPANSPPGGYGDAAAVGGAAGSSSAFTAALEQAKRELAAGRLPEAHYQLSRWFDDPSLTPTELQQLTELLDQLAGTVIYSTQNLLEPACEVQPGETLERIAQRYNVPWQLLAKINGIDDPHSLRPGERLKVVRGPFNAVVSLDKRVLTLLLDSAYAGRFPIGLGRDHSPVEGQYFVVEKTVDPVYHGAGRTYERGDRENPLGHRWLGLGNQIGIHGTNDPRYAGRTDLPGSINLNERDVDDVFDILGEGSKVVIRR